MTQSQFIDSLKELYADNIAIAQKKNSDYATDKDPFANFRACEMFGIKAEKGIIVRMTDKLMRVSNLVDKQAAVVDESILDTLYDLANYAMILRAYIENK